MTTNSLDRRQAATERYATAARTINAAFDAHDRLRVMLAELAELASGPDALRAARSVLDAARAVEAGVDELRAAAAAAAEHRAKAELAADLDTRAALLFPRPAAVNGAAGPANEIGDKP
jgi:hypothetical protein